MLIFIQRVIGFFTALGMVISNFLGISLNVTDKKVDDFKVTTYIRGDAVMYWGGEIYEEDFDIITDAIIFECATFNVRGEVEYDAEKMETVLERVRGAIGDRDVRLTLNLIGPWGNSDSDAYEDQMEAQSDEHNKAFESGVLEDNIVAVLERYDFDGVHFDYEYPLSLKAWHYYNRFLVSLDKRLGDDYTLGVAGNAWNIKFTNAAIEAIDTFELMSYDYIDEQGRHATYEDTLEQIHQLGLKGIPFYKVNVGIPFYSRPTDLSAYWYGYNGCYEKMTEDGWYHCDDIDKDFWFNTLEVVAQKTDYCIRNGFGGVMIWHYNCDLPSSHEDSLLRSIGETVAAYY
ncbi:MAG: glycoside hydrolase family 18 protein [Clostridia bacterium]|nr:glycoside hydrolase family 18 protein [Clostridia bacterium]